MSARSFLDSNILVYTDDGRARAKQKRAVALYEECRLAATGVVSLQVLQEYFATATKKLRVDAAVARRKVEIFGRMHLYVPQLNDVIAAVDLHRLHGLSFWDAMIVRAAMAAGCGRLYSEDLQAGRRFEGLEIVNPFA